MSQPSSNPPSPTIETSTPSIVVPSSNATHVDIESPYFLYSSNGTSTTLVVNLLTGIDNYYPWSLAITMALKGRNKFCFVDGTLPTPPAIDPHHAHWHRVNNMVMSWLLNSIRPSLAHTVLYAPNDATVWADLKERFSTANGRRIYDLERRIATIRQQDYSIADYHNILCALWDELTLLDPPPVCTCSARTAYASQMERRRLFQFLMGLRDTYTQTRSNLLLKTTMPTVKATYSLLLQDEAQRIIYQSDSPATSVALQTTAHGKSSLSSNVPLSSVVPPTTVDTSILGKYPPPLQMTGQTNEMTLSFANVAHQPYTRSTQTRSRPKCTHCGLLGHTQQVCYKLHGSPPGHKYYKKGNTNGIPSSTPKPPPPITGSISSDSIQQLLHLLHEVKEPKANLASMSLTLASIFNASTEWVIDTGATDHCITDCQEAKRVWQRVELPVISQAIGNLQECFLSIWRTANATAAGKGDGKGGYENREEVIMHYVESRKSKRMKIPPARFEDYVMH
nr:uncharacterized protein LOC109158736 [Ipomoea batatas]